MSSQIDGFIERAGSRLQDARNALESFRHDVSISNSIESIELSAKATFLLLGAPYPMSRAGSSPGRAAGVPSFPGECSCAVARWVPAGAGLG
jgi:hypothetical protein